MENNKILSYAKLSYWNKNKNEVSMGVPSKFTFIKIGVCIKVNSI